MFRLPAPIGNVPIGNNWRKGQRVLPIGSWPRAAMPRLAKLDTEIQETCVVFFGPLGVRPPTPIPTAPIQNSWRVCPLSSWPAVAEAMPSLVENFAAIPASCCDVTTDVVWIPTSSDIYRSRNMSGLNLASCPQPIEERFNHVSRPPNVLVPVLASTVTNHGQFPALCAISCRLEPKKGKK